MSPTHHTSIIPGRVRTAEGSLELNAGRETVTIVVVNDGDRPVQVGSHFHFAQVNEALRFDRAAAQGFRLDIASGTAVRFEPGASREVTLVRLAGRGVVPGLQLASTDKAPDEPLSQHAAAPAQPQEPVTNEAKEA